MPRLDGIDIYHGQADKGTVNLGMVAAIPTWWFACKATQSTSYVDPFYRDFQTAAKPLFSHRLGYHWLSSITDPNAQADWFLTKTNGADGIGAMQDMEEAGITVPKCLAWFERVEAHTHRPGVGYGGLYVTGGTIWNSPELRMSAYGRRPFIVAAYVTLANLLARMKALHSLPYEGWQYSSSGPVAGIVGRCDMDQIDDRPAFDLACGINHQPQLEEDMDVVTNAEQLTPNDPPLTVKFAVAYRGQSLYHLSGPEWAAGGSKDGVALSNADLDAIAAIPMPTTPAPTFDIDALATAIAAKIPPATFPANLVLDGNFQGGAFTGTVHT